MSGPNKPNWEYWKNLAEVELLQAVELSCDIAPGWVSDLPTERYIRADHLSIKREVIRRMAIARSHVGAGTFKLRRRVFRTSGIGMELDCITLSEFRAWGESLPTPITFPDEFPRTTPQTAELPEELRAALEAFNAVSGDIAAATGKSPKTLLLAWLQTNKPGLSANARDRVATVANWQPTGGAPKTPDGKIGPRKR